MKIGLKGIGYDDWLPDFRLTKPDELHANPNHARKDPASLVVPLLDRLPMQPPMPSYNPRIAKNRLWEKPAKPIGQMLHTERLFHLLSRERAVIHDTEKRIHQRWVEEKTHFELFGEHWVDQELLRRVVFYHKVADIVVSRKAKHEKARAFQLAAWQFLRERTVKRADKDEMQLEFLVRRAAEKAKHWLAFRTDDLYVQTSTHAMRRLKGHGQPRENVMNDLHWELARLVTEMNHKWRLADLRVTTPNGSIQHVKHGGGKHVEQLTAEIHEPLVRRRTDGHEYWHDTNFLIMTPNHSLMRAKQQGGKPEAATAALAQPLKDLRRETFEFWHDRNFLIETPNHGLQRATRQGSQPELATANLHVPLRDEKTRKFRHWHDRSYLVETPNHSLQPATKQGSLSEKAHAALEVPLRDAKTAKFQHWHDRNYFVETPNHSLQPATKQGARPEAATANLQLPVLKEKTAGFELWHASHEFKHTPNGGYAPLVNAGQSIEKVAGEFTQGRKAQVTAHHLAERLANLYTPTENGTWRRLARSGQSVEHVTADVKEHHDRAELDAAARSSTQRTHRARQSLKEIHKNLAAHETQKSLFHDHALKRPEPLPEKAAAANVPEPVPDLPKIKKAG